MSLCYDFEKWTMITLPSIAISLSIGLVLMQYAHGQTLDELQNQVNQEHDWLTWFVVIMTVVVAGTLLIFGKYYVDISLRRKA